MVFGGENTKKTATIIADRDGNLTNCKRVTVSQRQPARSNKNR